MFLIDGVCHPYNFHPDNLKGRFGKAFADVLFGYHPNVNPSDIAMTREEWSRDWGAEEFMDVMFLESELDMACMHSLPIYDAFEDGGSAAEKGAYLKKHYPDRVLWYAGVDMFEGARAVDEAKRRVERWAAHARSEFEAQCSRPKLVLALMAQRGHVFLQEPLRARAALCS